MGVRFQAHPRDESSQIVIHVRMLDRTNAGQQEALGIVGVNLVYGACMAHHSPEQLIESLLDNLSTERIEIDMIEFRGIEFHYYRLAAYLGRYTRAKIGITMGIGSLIELFDEKYYTQLDGGILESFGRLFKNDLKLYVYPLKDAASGEMQTVENLQVAAELKQLYGHLIDRGCIEGLSNHDETCLGVFSRAVLVKIAAGDPSWESMVPQKVVEVIKARHYFGHAVRSITA